MKKISLLMPSSLGLLILGIMTIFVHWNDGNVWIALSAMWLIMSAIVFAVTRKVNAMEDRMKILEDNRSR